MIKANELRIGNLVNTNLKLNLRVYAVNNKHVEFNEDGLNAASLEAILPIPLTPEILEKCGFVKNGFGNIFSKNPKYEYHNNIVWNIIADKHSGYKGLYQLTIERLGNQMPMCVDLQHLHQLQNLYFALTNTELEINL